MQGILLLHYLLNEIEKKGWSRVQFLRQGGACNSVPNEPNDFPCRVLLWVTIEFWSSQGNLTYKQSHKIKFVTSASASQKAEVAFILHDS